MVKFNDNSAVTRIIAILCLRSVDDVRNSNFLPLLQTTNLSKYFRRYFAKQYLTYT